MSTTTTTQCVGRPNSIWPNCPCEQCTTRRRRNNKLHGAGIRVSAGPRQRAAASARLQHWLDLGWKPSAIGSVIGINACAAQALVTRHRNGDAMHSSTVRAVLTAPDRATGGRVGATGTTRRLQALAWMGWTMREIHDQIGTPMITLSEYRRGLHPTISARTANAITDFYAAAQHIHRDATRPRDEAAKHHWAPPAAWDDETIDDPAVAPEGLDPVRAHGRTVTKETLDEIRRLHRLGYSDAQVGEQVGRSAHAVLKLRHRNNIRRNQEVAA